MIRKILAYSDVKLFALGVVMLTLGWLIFPGSAKLEGQAAVNTVYNRCVPVTTSDTVDLALFSNNQLLTAMVYVGGAGNVVAVFPDGTTATFTAPPVGSMLPLAVRRINATSTTATLLIACYRF